MFVSNLEARHQSLHNLFCRHSSAWTSPGWVLLLCPPVTALCWASLSTGVPLLRPNEQAWALPHRTLFSNVDRYHLSIFIIVYNGKWRVILFLLVPRRFSLTCHWKAFFCFLNKYVHSNLEVWLYLYPFASYSVVISLIRKTLRVFFLMKIYFSSVKNLTIVLNWYLSFSPLNKVTIMFYFYRWAPLYKGGPGLARIAKIGSFGDLHI